MPRIGCLENDNQLLARGNELLQQEYCYFDVEFLGHWIEVYIGKLTGRIVIEVDKQTVLDETKWSLTHKSEFFSNGEKISLTISQRIFSRSFIVEIISPSHKPIQHVHKLREGSDYRHLFGKYAWFSNVIIAALNVLVTMRLHRTQGADSALLFGIVFTLLWWLVESYILRRRH